MSSLEDKIDELLMQADWTQALEQPWTAREKIMQLVNEEIGARVEQLRQLIGELEPLPVDDREWDGVQARNSFRLQLRNKLNNVLMDIDGVDDRRDDSGKDEGWVGRGEL